MRYTLDSMLPERAFQKRLGGYGPATLEGGGKGGGSSTTVVNQQQTSTPQLDPAQRASLNAQTNFQTGTIIPTYQNAVNGATNVYNQIAPGVNAAAQNYATIAGQAQNVLGQGGQAGYQSGMGALQNFTDPNYAAQQSQAALAGGAPALNTAENGLSGLFSNDYVSQQMMAALQPAQAQYQQNLANQGAQFGGAGQIGSARQALAQTQLAGSNAAAQQQAAAGVLNNIAGQRLQAGATLGQLGLGQQQLGAGLQNNLASQQLSAASNLTNAGMAGLQNAQAAGANQLAAAQAPQNLYNQYASVIFGTPASSYTPNFAGTQGMVTNTNGTNTTNSSNWNVGIGGAQGMAALGGLASLSDRRAKREITFVGHRGEHKIYTFKYNGSDETVYEGVMSDDVREYMPQAVTRHKDGYDRVNYSMLGLEMKVVA